MNGTPRQLPIEIWEYVIDWIQVHRTHGILYVVYPEGRDTLRNCSLVCRAWLNRARLHLATHVGLLNEDIPCFERTIKKNHQASSSIMRLSILNLSFGGLTRTPLSVLLIPHRFHNITNMELHGLDLTREHTWLSRALLPRSVRHLRLFIFGCKLSQLIRFINTFHSLTSLVIFFVDAETLEHNGQVLPKPYHIPTRSLTFLDLKLIPGVSGFLDWCIRAGSFFSHIRDLSLICMGDFGKTKIRSCIKSVRALLDQCRTTLSSLHLYSIHSSQEILELPSLCESHTDPPSM